HTAICGDSVSASRDDAAKINWNALGANRAKRDGTSRMPATISPMTAGCPQRVKIQATTPEAPMIMKSCRKSRLSGLVAFCRKLDCAAAKNDEPLTSVKCGVVAATGSVETRDRGGGS